MDTRSDRLKITFAGPRGGEVLVQTRCKDCDQLYKGMGTCQNCNPIPSEANLNIIPPWLVNTKGLIVGAIFGLMYSKTQAHPAPNWLIIIITILLLCAWCNLIKQQQSILHTLLQSIIPIIGTLIILECLAEMMSLAH